MKKIFWLTLLVGCIGIGLSGTDLQAKPGDVAARLRLYEGFRENMGGPAKVTTSYYLKSLTDQDVFAEVDETKEMEVLKRVFNMADVKLITDAVLVLKEGTSKTPFQVIVLNGRKLLVQMSKQEGQQNRFRVEVLENVTPPRSLLHSAIVLPEQKTTALGFEDSSGKVYFLSFHRGHDLPSAPSAPAAPSTPATPSTPAAPSVPGKPAAPPKPFTPRVIHKVEPVFPVVAEKAGVEGMVVLNATTDEEGAVVFAEVVEGHPLLRMAALNAIKQWRYEPYVVNGKKSPVKFTVLVKFNLNKEETPLPISNDMKPKLLKKADVVYPPDALKKHIEGKVVLEVTINTEGLVEDAVVIDGQPELNDAALTAIKQWQYEPYWKDGKKKKIKFTVVVNFSLKKK